jgi:hypothetical protein
MTMTTVFLAQDVIAVTTKIVTVREETARGRAEEHGFVSFVIPEGVNKRELIDAGWSIIDGREACYTIAEYVDTYTGESSYDGPFETSGRTLTGALNALQLAIAENFEERGFAVEFA